MIDFLSLGNLTLDDVVTADGRVATNQIGGNGAYAAAGMRVWGQRVGLVSVVGADFPAHWLERLEAAGIDVSAVQRVEGPHLLRSRAFYFPDGRRTDRVDEARPILPPGIDELLDLSTEYSDMGSPQHRRAWPLFSPTPALLHPRHAQAQAAHLAPGPVSNNRANAAYLKHFSAGKIHLTLDWPWWDWDQEAVPDIDLLALVDYLLPSREELQMHAGASDDTTLKAVGQALLGYGPRAMAIKCGSQGAWLAERGGMAWQHVPIYPTTVVDPTGAGDAFCGGFAVGIARTGNPLQAALHGAVSASFIIEGFGLQHALEVEPQDADRRLKDVRQRLVVGDTGG